MMKNNLPNNNTTPKPTLFHSTCGAKNPQTGKYDSFPTELTPQPQRTANGIEGNFVFAGSNKLIATAYALKVRASERNNKAQTTMTFGTSSRVPICIIRDDHGNLANHPEGKIFEVNNENFYQVEGEEEWVSEQKTSMTEVKTVTPDFAMKIGVQLFVVKSLEDLMTLRESLKVSRAKVNENVNALKGEGLPQEEFKEKVANLEDESLFRLLQNFADEGKMEHVNQTKNINPIDLNNGELEDSRFIEDDSKILEEPSKSVKKIADDYTKKLEVSKIPPEALNEVKEMLQSIPKEVPQKNKNEEIKTNSPKPPTVHGL